VNHVWIYFFDERVEPNELVRKENTEFARNKDGVRQKFRRDEMYAGFSREDVQFEKKRLCAARDDGNRVDDVEWNPRASDELVFPIIPVCEDYIELHAQANRMG